MGETLDNLDWDDLRVFVRVVGCRSISGAARDLGISHSTVSRRLARLEHVMDAALVERSRAGLVLTTLGRTVLGRAEEIESGILRLRGDVLGTGDCSGSVRLATMEGIASLFLAERLVSLARAHPALHVELITSASLVQMNHREADVFLSFFRPEEKDVESRRVGEFAIGLYASPAYLERHGRPREPGDLAAHAYVGYVDRYVRLEAVRWLEEMVERPRLAFSSNSMIAQRGAARGGLGIVALPHFACGPNETLERVLPGTEAYRELWLTIDRNVRSAPRVRALGDWIARLFEAESATLNGQTSAPD